MGYLTEVLNAAPAVANVAAYGHTIREKCARPTAHRDLPARRRARGTSTTARRSTFIDGAEQAIYEIARTPESSSTSRSSCASSCGVRSAQLQEAASRGDRITGHADRLHALRRLTAGPPRRRPHDRRRAPRHGQDELRPERGRERGAAARPRARRTTRTTRWEDPGHGVVVFSLEMPREQLANRMLCSEARVDVGKVRRGLPQPAGLEQAHAGGVAPRRAPHLDRRLAGALASSSSAPRCGACRPSTTSPTRTGSPASASASSSSTTCS